MEGWKYWEGKKVFIILRNKRQYSGIVLEVEQAPGFPTAFIIIQDKFNQRVTFASSEVELIQEERNEI